MLNRRISVAPMMACTDRHYRYLVRLISKHTLTYTEMVTANAIVHGDRDYLLGHDAFETPVALQLGGSEPDALAIAAKIGQDYGYQEININIGCPSERVQKGAFGACLMLEPELVAECVAAMRDAVDIDVTVKTRIGVDDQDDYESLGNFVRLSQQAGCETFIVHARKAWLKGLSPKENREIPPLHYDVVYQLKQDFPELEIIINGGIKTHEDIQTHLQHVDGVMLGRHAYAQPYFLAEADQRYCADAHEILTEREVIEAYLPYIQAELAKGVRLSNITRHLVGFFHGKSGAKQWRRYLSENASRNDVLVVSEALQLIATN